MTRLLLVTLILLTGCAAHTPKIDIPDRYYLPYVSDDAVLCVEQRDGKCSNIRAGDLRKFLASIGKA